MTAAETLASGDRIEDRYALVDRLGEGTFGDVWRARDTRLAGRLVTVKLLKREFLDQDDVVTRFEHEAEALALLHHPNVVAVLDQGAWRGLRYIVMEYVEGITLDAWLAGHESAGRRPDRDAVRELFADLCRGVAAAHAVRAPGPVVHRDLKPANVMLGALPTGERTVKVLDFGIARLGERRHTRSGALLGTLEYMAPEQGVGQAEGVGPWSDVYALGVILVEMLTGRSRPSREEPWWIVSIARGGSVRTLLGALDGSVPDAVWDVVTRALQGAARERPSDAGALLAALQRAWRASPSPTPAAEPPGAARAASARDPRFVLAPTALAEPRAAGRSRAWTYGPVAVLLLGLVAGAAVMAGGATRPGATRVSAPSVAPSAAPAPAASRCLDGMLWVPGGRYLMGSPEGQGEPDEHPRHAVRLAPYCMDRTEVTVRAYAACVGAGACQAASTVDGARIATGARQTLSEYCNGPRPGHEDHPINCVDWAMAQRFCQWRGARLPTEAEWEFSAVGGDGRRYPWGDADPTTQLCWSGAMRRTESCPAGSHPRGASPFGLMDLAGGVYEWTGDRFGPYPSAAGEVVDPRGSTVGATRVYRGGSWRSDVASFVRAASRISIAPTSRSYVVGFRCAADVRPAGHVPD